MALITALALLAFRPSSPLSIGSAELYGSEPQVAASRGEAYVAYGSGDQIFVTRSDDEGQTFLTPGKLPTSGHLALGMRRGPRIAAAGNDLVVLAVYGRQGGGKDGDVLAWRSSNAGQSWQGPAIVSDVSGSASEGLHAVAASPQGRFASAWLDHRAGSAEIWSSYSDDGGKTWSKNVRAYRSPDGHVCECCHPSVAFGPKGELYVMFRNWLGGSRDMYLSTSQNGGNAFEPAVKLGQGTWPLNACPMDGGSVGVRADGSIDAIWRRERAVFASRPGQAEVEISSGTQPWLAIGPNATSMVWQENGRIVGSPSGRSKVELGVGRDPVVAWIGSGFLAAWTDPEGKIKLKRLG
jgi:hypothetical protein